MRYILLFLLFFVKQFSAQVCYGKKVLLIEDGKPTQDNLQLVFEDHFDQDSLDQNKWYFVQPWGNHSMGGFNSSLEYQTDGLNYEFTKGTLKLLVKKEKFLAKAVQWLDSSFLLEDNLPNKRWWDYTAGMIYSKQEFGYGKYEMRCKIPKGKGFWSVFWLYGKESEEIDVFEFWTEENMFNEYQEKKLSRVGNMTSHARGNMCQSSYEGPDYSQDFHTFSVIWNNSKIEWYADGELKRTSYKFYTLLGQPIEQRDLKKDGIYIQNKTFPLYKLNIGVSLGIQPGRKAPDKNTPFPSNLEIDYIRYWEFQ